MGLSIRKWVGIAGLALLLIATQIAVSLRRENLGEMLDLEGWLWALMPSAFMGLWGWITLWFSRVADTRGASKALIAVALLYFVIMAFLTFDIILNGNSTSGIAFFFLPGIATVVMLPLIGLVIWFGQRLERREE